MSYIQNNDSPKQDESFEYIYPLTVRLKYLEPFFRSKKAVVETVHDPYYTYPPPTDFDWHDKGSIQSQYPPRKGSQYGNRQIPQALIQDVEDPDDEERTQANRLIIINLWRSMSQESQRDYFTYLKNNIFARPTINNDLLPGSKYAQIQAQQNQHTKRAGRSGFAIATDGLEVLQKFVEESYCAKYFKSGKGRKINESVETNAQMLDKTSIRLRDAAQKATRKANQATTIKQGANVDTFSEIITIAATNGNLNPKGGGRNFDRVGEGGNRSDGVNFQISCRSKEIAEKLIGEEAIKEMGKGNNTIEFDTLDKSPLYKKRRMERKRPRPKSAQSVEKIAKKSSRRNALSDSDGDCKRALDYQVENVDCNDI